MDLMVDLVQKLSGLQAAYENFLEFFNKLEWKEPWIVGLMEFHALLLLLTVLSRRHFNFQFFLFLLALAGVYFAENLNQLLGKNWKSFSNKNYFDPHGAFLAVIWSGPLLVNAMIIMISTLYSLCYLTVKWKRAELRHRVGIVQGLLMPERRNRPHSHSSDLSLM